MRSFLPSHLETLRKFEVVQVTAQYLEWDKLPVEDYQARLDYVFERFPAAIKNAKDVTDYLDRIGTLMDEARSKIGFYPLTIIEYISL